MADMMIPEGWSVKTLSALAFIDRKSLSGKTDPNFQFKYIDIASVKTAKIDFPSNYISFKEAPSRARRCVQMGDVLMSTVRPNLQSFAYFDKSGETFVASTGFAVITAKKISCGKFLYYSILSNSVARQIEALVVGSNYPAINSADVKNLEILEPPLPEQQKIATILSSVDTVIEKTRAQIDKLKHLKTGMMQELLTQGIGHTEFKNTPVGRIPKAWRVVQFKDVFTLNYGKSPKDIIAENGANTVWGTGGETAKTNNFLYEGESIVLGRKGTIDQPRYVTGKFWVIDTAYYSSNHGENNVRFLHYALQIKNLKALNEASGVPSLSRDTLYAEWVALPSPVEQQEIAKILSSVEKKLAVVKKKLASLKNTKKALMQDLLTGKVRIKLNK